MKHILQQQKNGYHYARLDECGALQETLELDSLDALSAQSVEGDWYCLMSGENILTTTAPIPENTSRSRLRDLVPYALEDQLVDPIESLHFALGDRIDPRTVVVCVVKKSVVQDFLNSLSALGIQPTVLMPDYLGLPLEDDCASLAIYEARAVVRLSRDAGFATDVDLLKPLLESQQAALGADFPTQWHWYLVSSDSRSPLVSWGAIQHSVTTSLSFEESIDTILNPAVNLMQGIFSSQRLSRTVRRRWMRSAYLALGLFVLTTAVQVSEWVYLNTQSQRQGQVMTVLYQRLFPGRAMPESLSLREIRHLLLQRRRDIHRNQFLWLLDRLSPAIDHRSATLTQIRFASHRDLILKLILNRRSDAKAILKNLNAHDWHIKHQVSSVTNQGKWLLEITVGVSH